MNKITNEELETIKAQQSTLQTLIYDIGLLQTQQHSKLHEIAQVNEGINEHKTLLEKKYGSININVEDGTYTEIEKEAVVENA
jgi:hypothetical protein